MRIINPSLPYWFVDLEVSVAPAVFCLSSLCCSVRRNLSWRRSKLTFNKSSTTTLELWRLVSSSFNARSWQSEFFDYQKRSCHIPALPLARVMLVDSMAVLRNVLECTGRTSWVVGWIQLKILHQVVDICQGCVLTIVGQQLIPDQAFSCKFPSITYSVNNYMYWKEPYTKGYNG